MDASFYGKDYLINPNGTIQSLKLKTFGNLMKFRKDKDGYLIVNLCIDGVKRTEKVHRLVAQKHVSNPFNLPEINHDDGNKENNNDWNLKWSDRANNVKHAYNTGLRRSRSGEFNRPTKKVLQIDINGKLINEFGSYAEAERITGVSNAAISVRVNTGRLAGGYLWESKKLTT